MEITGNFNPGNHDPRAAGAFTSSWNGSSEKSGDGNGHIIYFQASRTWTGTTNTAQPQTVNLGKGTPFSILPPYLVVNIWKRLS